MMWFLTDAGGRIRRPVSLMRHFEKQASKASESRELTFTTQPNKDLSYPAARGQRRLAAGFCTLRGGGRVPRLRYAAGGAAGRRSVI
jgi:beta-glucosidase